GEVPEVFSGRSLSLRAFYDQGMIVVADLIYGDDPLGPALDRLLAIPTAACAHIHYAKFWCYTDPADRFRALRVHRWRDGVSSCRPSPGAKRLGSASTNGFAAS